MAAGPSATVTGRTLAARVLRRVWEAGAWAAPTLDAELSRHPTLDAREARLATEIVYGVLRTGAELERRVAALAHHQRWRRAAAVRAHLLIAVYSLVALDRVPTYAAVSEAVEAIRREGDERLASFANAILRRIATQLERGPRPTPAELAGGAMPPWLAHAFERALGPTPVDYLTGAGLGPPPLGIALFAGEQRDAWLQRLREAAPTAEVQPGTVSPRAINVRGAGDLRRLPGADVAWTAQEEGAQVVALAAGGRPGERVLDACAGRGGKAWALAEAVGPEGAVDAADRLPRKLERMARDGGRRPAVRQSYAVDWTVGPGDVPTGYDRALVDAPCSGVGTLRRRPEILQRLEPGDVRRLQALQITIVKAVASRVRAGGRLVYAVCSVLREETEEVVAALAADGAAGARLVPCELDSELGRRLAAGRSSLLLRPDVHGTDGYFVASFRVER